MPAQLLYEPIPLFGPTCGRVHLTAFLDGPQGGLSAGYTVSHGLDEDIVLLEAGPWRPLTQDVSEYAERWCRLVNELRHGLSPF